MGRKIPAKKHRGVKDPLVQQAKRLASLKGKINAPPKDPDEQPVPKSLSRLFAFQDVDRQSTTKKKSHNSRRQVQGKDGSTVVAAHNPMSRLRKLPGESGRGFSLRINSAVKALHNPAEELHYPLDFEADDAKGLRMSEQRERRARKRLKAAKAAQKSGHHEQAEPHLTRTQKLALKKKAKKTKASEAMNERHEVVYDRVSFGEVTHAPPTLHFKHKGNTGAPRPGKRDLLLNSLLAGGNNSNKSAPVPPAELQRRERARLDAVAAYRALKATKLKMK